MDEKERQNRKERNMQNITKFLGITVAIMSIAFAGTVAGQTLDFSIITSKDDLVFSQINGYDLV